MDRHPFIFTRRAAGQRVVVGNNLTLEGRGKIVLFHTAGSGGIGFGGSAS